MRFPFALLLLFWHGAVCVLCTFNYAMWMRFQEDSVVPRDQRYAYLAFDVVGLIAYAAIAGPALIFAHKYGATAQARTNKLQVAVVAMYFAHTLPQFLNELTLLWNAQRILAVLDGVCFVLLALSWMIGSMVTWFIYLLQASRFLQSQTGADRQVQFSAPGPSKVPQLSFAPHMPGQPAVI